MIIDNFDLINNFLRFEEDGSSFYFLQIIRRKKENPTLSSSYTVKTYFIKSNDQLEYLKSEIILLCKQFNARAYINLNIRDYKQVFNNVNLKLAENLILGNYACVLNIVESVCGEVKPGKDKYWLVDIDYNDVTVLNDFKREINLCESSFPTIKPFSTNNLYDNIVLEVPTLNGYHLITRPFNLKQLEPFICTTHCDIHKNNPTILYYGNSN